MNTFKPSDINLYLINKDDTIREVQSFERPFFSYDLYRSKVLAERSVLDFTHVKPNSSNTSFLNKKVYVDISCNAPSTIFNGTSLTKHVDDADVIVLNYFSLGNNIFYDLDEKICVYSCGDKVVCLISERFDDVFTFQNNTYHKIIDSPDLVLISDFTLKKYHRFDSLRKHYEIVDVRNVFINHDLSLPPMDDCTFDKLFKLVSSSKENCELGVKLMCNYSFLKNPALGEKLYCKAVAYLGYSNKYLNSKNILRNGKR